MVLYDANDDEVHQINYGRLDESLDEDTFTINHPEPYGRPVIALNFTNEQISELRGVCFSDSFNLPNKVKEDADCWRMKMPNPFSTSCVKIIGSLILIIGWSSFFAIVLCGSIEKIEINNTNRWTVLTLIFMMLVLSTICVKKLFSRYQGKCDSSLKSSSFHRPWWLPCCESTKEEESRILYSVKT